MNITHLYDRTFQTVFAPFNRILNDREPVVILREGALMEIPALLAGQQVRRPMIVTGPRVSKSEAFGKLCDALGGSFALYSEVKPDPPIPMVREMIKLYQSEGCDGIIAIGGGSNIDAAKAMGAGIVRPRTKLSHLGGTMKVRKKLPFFIAVPTTAGTGSECTVAAVVTDGKTGRKFAINDPVLCPDVAVLDPALSVSMTPSLTANTGMDALTHAIEAYLNKTYHRKGTKHTAVEAVRTILEWLPAAYENGADLEARAKMLVASYQAGKAFTAACVGNVHAIAHTIGGKYHTPHGLANAVVLPYVLKAYLPDCGKDLAALSRTAGVSQDADDRLAAAALIARIEEMNASFGIPQHIEGIREEDLEEMARWADKEANPLYPVPVIFSREDFKRILRVVGGLGK